jgi:hypothetical protein
LRHADHGLGNRAQRQERPVLNEAIADALEAPYNAAEAQGRMKERERIVKWMRELFPAEDDKGFHHAFNRIADAIESGAHHE